MHIDTIFCLQVSIGDNHHLLVKMDGDLEIKITTMDHLRNLNGDFEVMLPPGSNLEYIKDIGAHAKVWKLQ